MTSLIILISILYRGFEHLAVGDGRAGLAKVLHKSPNLLLKMNAQQTQGLLRRDWSCPALNSYKFLPNSLKLHSRASNRTFVRVGLMVFPVGVNHEGPSCGPLLSPSSSKTKAGEGSQ